MYTLLYNLVPSQTCPKAYGAVDHLFVGGNILKLYRFVFQTSRTQSETFSIYGYFIKQHQQVFYDQLE